MISDILLEVLLAVLEEKIKVVWRLFDIKKLYNVRMFEIL